MKRKILGAVTGAALLAIPATSAFADTDVWLGVNLGIPAPVVVTREPVYYYEYEPAPVHYHEYRAYPRRYVYRTEYEVREYERHRHDRGWHRGHHKHKHHHR